MGIGSKSQLYFKLTKSKEKMYEYFVPEEDHIKILDNINIDELFFKTLSVLGDFCVDVIEDREEKIIELGEELEFCSYFFEAYINGKINMNYSEYMRLIAAATYYLCNKVGNSNLLVKDVKEFINIGGEGLENLLICILKNDYNLCENIGEEVYHKKFIKQYLHYYKSGCQSGDFEKLYELSISNRKAIYNQGSPRELLLIDIICAILKIKIRRFPIVAIPKYTDISVDKWRNTINDKNFIKELWSSQIELGEKDVYRGKSSVIQMPTSSGKTKSIEIIIRSAILSNRIKFAIIVTPFRALCRELSLDLGKAFENDKEINISEMSEILRDDFSHEISSGFTILIFTPEKLLYLMRKVPGIIDEVGLAIFDEAHLFDDPTRGINYELLITMIKTRLKGDVQKIVISAIISNASTINGWINGENGVVIDNDTTLGGEKSIAFIEKYSKNQFALYFVENKKIDEQKYYVPKVVNKIEIGKKPRERNIRYFPDDKLLNKDISISIANRLCINGGVAIFCGRKDSAKKIVERILDIEERGVNIESFARNSDKDETKRIYNLFVDNIGSDNPYARACEKGVFSHHSNIPEGIKSSIEFAMRMNKIKAIVCTSTLAQGVNLPIRYLLIPTIYQAGEEIKVRDFHNLIGRTGRAGMYTEGSIIFTEPGVYSRRGDMLNWKWQRYERLVNKSNSEPCESHLLRLIKYKSDNQEVFDYILGAYMNYSIKEITTEAIKKIDQRDLENEVKEAFKAEVLSIINIIKELENFVLSIMTNEDEQIKVNLNTLGENTFAYFLANDSEKLILKEVVTKVYEKVKSGVGDDSRKSIYGRTMLSLNEIMIIENWIDDNIDIIEKIADMDSLVESIFEVLLKTTISDKIIDKVKKSDKLIDIYKLWISGISYYDILKFTVKKDLKIRAISKYNYFSIDEIIEICNNSFGYKASITISAIQEIIQGHTIENDKIYDLLDELCRRSRYGLSSLQEVILYEIGFNDRVIAKNIKDIIKTTSLKKGQYKEYLKLHKLTVEKLLEEYPSVFRDNLNFILNS